MKFDKVKIIINPTANHGETRKIIHRVKNIFTDKLNADMILTERPKHAEEIAKNLADYDLVIAVGGDGTAHEVVNGLALSNNQRTVLGLIPTGSGNDFCSTLGIPKNLEAAAQTILEGEIKTIDLGVVNGTYYSNSLGIGFDARVAHLAGQVKKETKRSGLTLYLTAVFRILFGDYYCHPVSIKIDDSEWITQEIVLMAVNNGTGYGGGFKITPHADPTDGLLDVCLVDALPAMACLPRIPFVITGRHQWMKVVHTYRAKKVMVRSETELPAHLDGELMKDKGFLIEIVPQALKVLVPKRKEKS